MKNRIARFSVISTILCPKEMSKPVARIFVVIDDLKIVCVDRYTIGGDWTVSVIL